MDIKNKEGFEATAVVEWLVLPLLTMGRWPFSVLFLGQIDFKMALKSTSSVSVLIISSTFLVTYTIIYFILSCRHLSYYHAANVCL